MNALALRRHAPDFGGVPPDRYSVLADGVEIGSISACLRPGGPVVWQWSITVVPAAPPTSGTADTLVAATAEFRAAWDGKSIDLNAWRRHMDDVQRRAAMWSKIHRPV